MKVALAHDSFTQLGGAERVIECLHEIFPYSTVYTLVVDSKLSEKYKNWKIAVSWLQKFYNFVPRLKYWLFFIPLAVKGIDFQGNDVIVSASSGFIRNLRKPKKTIHIDYCHTPARFLWQKNNYISQEVPWLFRPPVRAFLNFMRKWDYAGAQTVDYFIANSKEVQDRIKRHYNKDSKIIYPFVDVNFWKPTKAKDNYFLIAGRLQAHKANAKIVEIFNKIGKPLHVVGTGRQENYLKSISGKNVTFLGRVSDERLREEYSGALGLIFPQLEDFGLMPLEAAACGTATIALRAGGSLETVVGGVTGEFLEHFNYDTLSALLKSWNYKKYRQEDLFSHAAKFSKERFKKEITFYFKNINPALCE